jgi:hypothetical protein
MANLVLMKGNGTAKSPREPLVEGQVLGSEGS